MVNVVMLNVVMLSAIILNVVMLSAIMLIVVMLNVVVPFLGLLGHMEVLTSLQERYNYIKCCKNTRVGALKWI